MLLWFVGFLVVANIAIGRYKTSGTKRSHCTAAGLGLFVMFVTTFTLGAVTAEWWNDPVNFTPELLQNIELFLVFVAAAAGSATTWLYVRSKRSLERVRTTKVSISRDAVLWGDTATTTAK